MSKTNKDKTKALVKRGDAPYVANNPKGQKTRNERPNKGNLLHQLKVAVFGE